MCKHRWAKLVGENFKEVNVRVCVKCGALKLGNSVTITGDFIDLALLSANPTGVEGRVCYNSADKKVRHYDGSEWKDWW